jgi:VWFA-related protein
MKGFRFSFWFATFAVVAGLTQPVGAQQPAQGTQDEQPPVPTLRADVDVVNILFTVKTKKNGQLVPGLEQKDFKVFEDGASEKMLSFTRETDLPLTLGLLIDISASQGNLIDIERLAASQFFSSVLRQKDEAFLISFGRETDLLQDYTSSARQLSSALTDLRGDPMDTISPMVNPGPIPQTGTPKGTLLFDAVYLASNEKLKSETGRKALILITDGEDQGSTYRLQEAVQAAQRSDAIIYSIYYVDRRFYAMAGMMGGSGEGDLEKMSQQTGGHVFKVDKKHTLADIFKEIQDELRNQYSISYAPTRALGDESFRKVEIKVDNSDYRVQARAGYYATKHEAE